MANTTSDGTVFADVNKMNNEVYKLLQDNVDCILPDQKSLLCNYCQKVNIQAKKCKRSKLSICFSCQIKYDCKDLEIDEETRKNIKEINFCCKCEPQKKMKYDVALEHFRKCSGQKIQNNIQFLNHENENNIRNDNITNEKNQQSINSQQPRGEAAPNASSLAIKNAVGEGEDTNRQFKNQEANQIKTYSRRNSPIICIILCCCQNCECKDNKFCICKCKTDNGEEKNCLDYLFKEKVECISFILVLIKSLIGLIFSVITILNLKLIFDDESLSESEKEEINKIIHLDIAISVIDIALCIISLIIGCILFRGGECKKILATVKLITNTLDFIIGDMFFALFTDYQRKKFINYLTNDSNQEIIQVIQDSYNNSEMPKWILFGLKVLLFIIIEIICFVYLCNIKKNQ